MTLDYQIKMIDDLIKENEESTIKDFSDILSEIQEIEKEVTLRKIGKVDYSKISLLDFGGR